MESRQVHTTEALIGQRLGDYLIVGLLGQGGFGKVYLALQLPIMMKTALKLIELPFDDALAEVVVRKFEAEAAALAALNHPNIVRLLKFGTHMGLPYLVMEYVADARTLLHELDAHDKRGELLPLATVKHILKQVANGLEAAHRLHIVHRDVKPENVMLQEVVGDPFMVRILDFGLAKFVAERSETSVTMGTPMYMAPEQLMRQHIGPWTDVYALGVLAYELLVGARPFDGTTHQTIFQQKLDPTFDPTSAATQLPEAARTVLRRAMAHDIDARFASATQLRDALEDLTRSQPQATPGRVPSADETALLAAASASTNVQALVTGRADAPAPTVLESSRRRSTWTAVGAAVAAVAFLAWIFWPSAEVTPHPDPPPVTASSPTPEAAPSALVPAAGSDQPEPDPGPSPTTEPPTSPPEPDPIQTTGAHDVAASAADVVTETPDATATPPVSGVTIVTRPPNANVIVEGREHGTTPRLVQWPTGSQLTVQLQAEGFKAITVTLSDSDAGGEKLVELSPLPTSDDGSGADEPNSGVDGSPKPTRARGNVGSGTRRGGQRGRVSSGARRGGKGKTRPDRNVEGTKPGKNVNGTKPGKNVDDGKKPTPGVKGKGKKKYTYF